MILSFHPCYEADTNIICAGREPDEKDRSAIAAAAAVILPQGCRESLYRMARQLNRHVFPNYDARFEYPGKTGQARLFKALNVPHPKTWVFQDTAHFRERGAAARSNSFPLVFKLDWGGEGDTVFLLHNASDLDDALATAATYERTGQSGFIIQAFVPQANRTLRVVVVGQTMLAYWRIQEQPGLFGTSLSKGARIDTQADPHLRRKAMRVARRFCNQSRIDLAGLDFIFDQAHQEPDNPQAMLLEINYFFGRTGLGGSERFYALLKDEIDRWLMDREIAPCRAASRSPGERR